MGKTGLELILLAVVITAIVIIVYNSYKNAKFVKKTMDKDNGIYNKIPEYSSSLDENIKKDLKDLLIHKKKKLSSLLAIYVKTGDKKIKSKMDSCFRSISIIRNELTEVGHETSTLNIDKIHQIVRDTIPSNEDPKIKRERIDKLDVFMSDIEKQLTHKRKKHRER